MFDLGQTLATPGALAALEQAGQEPADFLARHQSRDWGELSDEDKILNNESLKDGSRVLSVYRTRLGAKIWIITEAADDQGRRTATTVILPEEY